jgi:hypothetical protein
VKFFTKKNVTDLTSFKKETTKKKKNYHDRHAKVYFYKKVKRQREREELVERVTTSYVPINTDNKK